MSSISQVPTQSLQANNRQNQRGITGVKQAASKVKSGKVGTGARRVERQEFVSFGGL